MLKARPSDPLGKSCLSINDRTFEKHVKGRIFEMVYPDPRSGHGLGRSCFLLEVIVPNWFETSAGHQFAPNLKV